jgi:hypothetical protein
VSAYAHTALDSDLPLILYTHTHTHTAPTHTPNMFLFTCFILVQYTAARRFYLIAKWTYGKQSSHTQLIINKEHAFVF